MIYVDSNALVYLLHDVKPKSDLVIDALSSSDEVYTSLRTIEEASYILVRIYLSKHYGARGIHQIREIIRKYGLEPVKDELATLRRLLSDYNVIILQDKATINEIHETMIKYKLLPGDAIIALTCKHYGVDTILTFDEDFRRVPWLKVNP
ncbi:PIN domain-containing protein [Aeropyrum camini]|uniref:Predicted nucleic acid-binding protein n=1 Tax=Aeropyrum camini SY1 = JCM 12091 TaxID=1198449 RepID=U3TGI3_9CREN|nr:PIN domain-containing protein [Aeropyrum camini]BAN91108.1 predicted nucleic acid-binding protein [Aeropyrum camini SY1 = JCM 12091]